NVLLERFGAKIWLTRIMVTWGLIAAAMACCSTGRTGAAATAPRSLPLPVPPRPDPAGPDRDRQARQSGTWPPFINAMSLKTAARSSGEPGGSPSSSA
ncbi:MAG: hypothetical protein QOI83_71, partial [Streptomycetaceae bacterium]|nr:hypothetical protein [Streptomycetaceae bacterium]